MNDLQKNDTGPAIAWELFTPLPTSVRQVEDQQSALRKDFALFDEAEMKATAWVERRQLAFESGLKALSEISACKDPVTAAAIYSRWLCSSMNRIAEDVQDAQDFAVKVAAVGQQTAQAMAESFPAAKR